MRHCTLQPPPVRTWRGPIPRTPLALDGPPCAESATACREEDKRKEAPIASPTPPRTFGGLQGLPLVRLPVLGVLAVVDAEAIVLLDALDEPLRLVPVVREDRDLVAHGRKQRDEDVRGIAGTADADLGNELGVNSTGPPGGVVCSFM